MITRSTDGDLSVWTSSGVCYSRLPVTELSIELQPAADAEPWSDLFIYRPMIDDKPWAPTLEEPSAAGTTRAFAECPASNRQVDPGIADHGLTLGKHKLRFEAKLLGATRVTSDDLTFDLDCSAAMSAPRRANTTCATTQVESSRPRALLLFTLVSLLLARRRKPRAI